MFAYFCNVSCFGSSLLNEIHVLSDVTEPSSTADGKASLPIHVYTAHVTVIINLGMYIVGTDSTYSVANPLCSVTESIAGSDDGLMFYSTLVYSSHNVSAVEQILLTLNGKLVKGDN